MRVQADMLAADIQAMPRSAAEPITPGELVIEQLRRAARRRGLAFSRARKLWYAECRVSAVDFVQVTSAMAASNDHLVAYQNAKAALLRERLDEARRRR